MPDAQRDTDPVEPSIVVAETSDVEARDEDGVVVGAHALEVRYAILTSARSM